MVQQSFKKSFVEFEAIWIEICELIDCIEELVKYGTRLFHLRGLGIGWF